MPDSEIEHPGFIVETGKICAGWALLEKFTDRILWGVLRVNPTVGAIISANKDMTGRWALIVNYSESLVEPDDLKMFRRIKKEVLTIATDRNIAVHGAILVQGYGKTEKCFAVVTRGLHAEKLNEINVTRMQTILKNIQIVSIEARKLAEKYHWSIDTPPKEPINLDWAKPIEGFP